MTATLYFRPVTDSPEDLLTVREVSTALGVNDQLIRDMLLGGFIPGERETHGWLVRLSDVRDRLGDVPPRGGTNPADDPQFAEMLAELGAFDTLIKATDALAKELIRVRNRAMLAWKDRGASTVAIAAAADMTRQNATSLLRTTRAEVRAERPQQ